VGFTITSYAGYSISAFVAADRAQIRISPPMRVNYGSFAFINNVSDDRLSLERHNNATSPAVVVELSAFLHGLVESVLMPD